MQDTPDSHAHFGWFKRRRHLKVDEITVVDKPMLKRAVGAAALGNAMEFKHRIEKPLFWNPTLTMIKSL